MKGELIGAGRTAEIYVWGNGQVLKLFRSHMPLRDVEYEHKVAHAVYQAGVRAPAVSGDVVEVDGRPGIIYERIDGVSMFRHISTRPWQIRTFARQLAELHAEIHRATSSDLPPQRTWLQRRIEYAPRLSDSLKVQTLQLLNRLPDDNRICHGDFHPDNILMTARGPMVIDWTNACRGHPLADVARTSLMLSAHTLPPNTGRAARFLIQRVRRLFHSQYLQRYCQLQGITPPQIEAWLPVVAAARLIENLPEENEWLVGLVQAAATG